MRRRPFVSSAGVQSRGCSRALQRAVTDLGADLPFAQAALKLREHYGVDLSASTIRRITERHAGELVAEEDAEPAWPTQPGVAAVIAEIDGGMVPLVQSDPESADRRRGKRVFRKEAKLSLAHAHGSTERTYGATLNGGVEVAGRQLLSCAIAAGLGTDTRLHALGDGAMWIADQSDGWVQIEGFGRAKQALLKQFLELPNGIPSHDTFGRVFSLLQPAAFEACFRDWVEAIREVIPGEVIAIDGKTLRRSHDRGKGLAALHLVSAWATANRVVLGQVATEVEEAFIQADAREYTDVASEVLETTEQGHGRRETRRYRTRKTCSQVQSMRAWASGK